jgi:hypothetical protein
LENGLGARVRDRVRDPQQAAPFGTPSNVLSLPDARALLRLREPRALGWVYARLYAEFVAVLSTIKFEPNWIAF